ncbi:MAG: C_GCAxxG_C_C family protein [Clostridiales bacterium]|nr:C_GCAxxG_C_C family protein [Clostridiales bacterium]
MIDHGEKAEQLFLEGYNCAQAVVCAFEDVTGLDREFAAKMSSSFGAGMGRMREVCGTVSGALIVLGIVMGYPQPGDIKAKTEHYMLVQEFAQRFKEKNGSIICRELLAGVDTTPGVVPEERTEEYYRKRPCPKLARLSAQIVEKMLLEKGIL